MSEDNGSPESPADVHALLARIDDAWRQFFAALDGIPEHRHELPGIAGDWSLKDLFGHFAFWDEHALQEIERALARQPRQDNEWQAMNDADYAARRDRSLPEQRSAMHQAHAALVERLAGVAGIDATRIDAAIKPDTYAHYEEHIPDVLAWRKRMGI